MEYTIADLARALERAEKRGPAAEAAFRARMDASFRRWMAGESIEAVCFDLFGDDPEGGINS